MHLRLVHSQASKQAPPLQAVQADENGANYLRLSWNRMCSFSKRSNEADRSCKAEQTRGERQWCRRWRRYQGERMERWRRRKRKGCNDGRGPFGAGGQTGIAYVAGPNTRVRVCVRAEDNHSETLWANIDAGCYRNNGQTCRDNARGCSPRTLYSRCARLCLYSRSRVDSRVDARRCAWHIITPPYTRMYSMHAQCVGACVRARSRYDTRERMYVCMYTRASYDDVFRGNTRALELSISTRLDSALLLTSTTMRRMTSTDVPTTCPRMKKDRPWCFSCAAPPNPRCRIWERHGAERVEIYLTHISRESARARQRDCLRARLTSALET